jgi:hypothetical protein
VSSYSDKELREIVAEERRGCEHGSTLGACSECDRTDIDLARECLRRGKVLSSVRFAHTMLTIQVRWLVREHMDVPHRLVAARDELARALRPRAQAKQKKGTRRSKA